MWFCSNGQEAKVQIVIKSRNVVSAKKYQNTMMGIRICYADNGIAALYYILITVTKNAPIPKYKTAIHYLK